jgi:hypothetical protein
MLRLRKGESMTSLLNWKGSRGPAGNRADYRAAIDRLDAISRQRALTDQESLLLERFIMRVESKRRVTYDNLKECARLGMKRHALP